MTRERIYLDHAATTPTDEAVVREMLPYFSLRYGNASSTHREGRDAVAAVDRAREKVAVALHAAVPEIYFTSGGTESDHWAIRSLAAAHSERGRHIVSSCIEHPAVLGALRALESEGYEITYLPVDRNGRISLSDLTSVLRDDTVLVTLMMVNNEVGTIQPIKEAASLAHERGAIFHTDAVQAAGVIPIDVNELGVDALSLSAHKFYGPKGVGALYLRRGVRISPFMAGGEQERSLRGGTYNTPGIVGLGVAIERAVSSLEEVGAHLRSLKSRFTSALVDDLVRVNGDEFSHPAIVNLLFTGVKNTELLSALDQAGIAASAGSACSAGSVEPSHVLTAMGRSENEVRSSVRFSFGKENTAEEIDRAVSVILDLLPRLRRDSDLFVQSPAPKTNV